MSDKKPFSCPVCFGHGSVSKPPHIPGDQVVCTAGSACGYPCHACRGTGIIWGPPQKNEPLF